MTEHKVYDSVSLVRGLGYSGRRITIVEEPCKICGYDRLIRSEHVYPEMPSDVEYFCRHPNCPEHESARRIVPRR
jgi:hypothetical protein